MISYHYSSVEAAENEPIASDEVEFRRYMDANNARRKEARKKEKALARKFKKIKNPQRRAASTPATKWLREMICRLVFGEKTPEGVRPSITKEQFRDRWNGRWGLPSLSNYRLLDHFAGKETLYYFGNGRNWAKETLVMIDIDVMKARGLGSSEGAKAFAQHLNQLWPNLYFETSTNGQGIHGYFVLRKWQWNAAEVNAALKRMEKWLRAEARRTDADIEQVEIKGLCLDMELQDRKVQSLKYGTFAKLPREVSRFSEWEKTTTMRVEDLLSKRFDVAEEAVEISDPVKRTTSVCGSVCGSVSGKIISEQELASIPAFETLYREWVGATDLKARKFTVSPHDFAVAMVILRHYKANPNPDGSLPCRRVEKLWTALFDSEAICRPWNHHRWKAIRDFLSFNGHIDWIENRYEYGTVTQDDGTTSQKGIACKWAITDEFSRTLEEVAAIPASSRGGASFVDTAIHNLIPLQGFGENLRPTPFPIRVELEQKFWLRAYEACETLCAA